MADSNEEQTFDLDEDLTQELLKREKAADREPKYSLEQSRDRTWRMLTESRSLTELSRK
jgi:hypothetical protein